MRGRIPYRPNAQCQLMFKSKRTAGILMAIPFVVCFAVFGIFNLIAGTVLTMMACKPKFPEKPVLLIERLFKEHSQKMDTHLDPMKVVGAILLTTGILLVIVGFVLGVVACRSANIESRRRNSCASVSGIQMSNVNGPTNAGSSAGRLKARLFRLKRDTPESTTTPYRRKATVVEVAQNEDSSVNGGPPSQNEDEVKSLDLATPSPTVKFPMDIEQVSLRASQRKLCTVTWAPSVAPSQSDSEERSGQIVEVVVHENT